MANWECPQEWSEWMKWLAVGLHGRCRWRLPILLLGVLFARGPRTVASWLRAAGIGTRLQRLLLLYLRRGTQVQIRGHATLLSAPAEVGPGRTGCCWPSTILPPSGTARRSRAQASITIPRQDRPTRSTSTATFGTTLSLRRAASAVGDDRAAPVGRALCATQGHSGPAHTTRLEFQTKLQQGVDLVVWAGRSPCRGKTAVGGRRWRLCQAAVPQATAETRRGGGQPPAKGCGA